MSLNATAWAARQYFRSSDEQLAAFVLAEMADAEGVIAFGDRERRRLAERARWDAVRLSTAIVGLYRVGAVDPYPQGLVVRLALERDFDCRQAGETER